MKNIVIIGAGTWGVAIANVLSDNGHNVVVWGRNSEKINNLSKTHIHEKLTDIKLNDSIIFTSDFDFACNNKDIIIVAVPSTGFRENFKNALKYINDDTYLISLTKGMENNTLFTMSEIMKDELDKNNIYNDKIVVLSGPTHAEEVAKKFPSTIVSTSKKIEYAEFVQNLIFNERFRVYTNEDIKGVEICASFKNIIAIGSGILSGLGFGDNIRAALITRGLTEMIRVGEKFGCKKETFYGLAGIGDMIVTACSIHSRNYKFGKLIGSGMSKDEAIEKVGMAVEGVNFLPKAVEISNKFDIELPISTGVNKIINENIPPLEMLTLLMKRKNKSE